jgi:methyl-accepting chemotaxis protein
MGGMAMNWFKNLKTRSKILVSFSIIIILMGIVGGVGILNLQKISTLDNELYENNTKPISMMNIIQVDLQKNRVLSRNIIIENEMKKNEENKNAILVNDKEIDKTMEQFKLTIQDQELINEYNNLRTNIDKYRPVRDKVIDLGIQNKNDEAISIMNGEASILAKQLDDSTIKLIDLKEASGKEKADTNSKTASTATLSMVGIMVIGIIIALVLGFLIAQLISSPINRVLYILKEMSNGHLGERADIKTNDEVGEMAKVMDSFSNLLQHEVIGAMNKIAKGDININVESKDERDEIAPALNKVVENIKRLVTDANMLSQAAIEGKFETRADATKHSGDYKKVIDGVNGTLDTVVDKVVWYEAIIDAIPFPIHVTDNDMNWTYMNKSFENLMINQGVVRDRKSGYGLACSHAGANICNTDKCGIKQLHKGKAESFFEWCGMSNKQDTSYLKNKNGENVGYVEVVTDLTSIMRVSDYTKREVKRLEENLKLLSSGNTDLDLKINEADKYTGEVKEQFDGINNSLKDVKNAIDNLLKDAIILSEAAIEGKFDTRADAEKHAGDYRKVIDGVNGTLDTVVDKVVWYEAIIDAIPFPIHVTDIDMNWTYMNKSFEKLMIEQGVVRDRKSGYGLACSHAGANICNTDKCGIKQLHKGKGESFFEWCGMSNKQDTSYLKNKKGENVGYVEVVTDLTPIIRVSDFTKTEVKRLEGNLKLLSNGDTNFDLNVKEADKYTGEVSIQFEAISNSLKDVKNAVDNLVTDANMLSNAATDGKLDIRADVAKHDGDFRKIVEGVNELIGEMVKPIKEVTHVMSEISKGNLEVPVDGNYKGEFGVLAGSVNTTEERLKAVVGEISEVIGEISKGNLAIESVREFDGNFKSISVSLNTIVESLNSVLSEINNAAEQVFTGAGQVSDGSQALSQGATEQASAIEELTSSIAEVAAQTKENAVNANEAKDLALNVKGNAEEGNRHMSEMLKSMGEINESSANISKIIKVIDEIAFQTNILALNAAVEAARAGQHGKGFAVVAEEVRNLAARSANAAKETTDLIEGSIKKAEKGTEIANNTAKALDEIVGGVSKAATLVAEIAASSNEQAIGISQINLGIEQVSQVVQTNSATAEESAAASEELSSQSEMLKEMVSSFKLKNSGNKHGLLNNNFKQSNNRQHYSEAYQEAAVSSKSKISLSDSNFDKY